MTTLLGSVVRGSITAAQLEFLPCDEHLVNVAAVCSEVGALCPVTAQPDLYRVTISYQPQPHRGVIESKALKLYLQSYRDVGIACEDLACAIAVELAAAADTEVSVVCEQQSRGGIVLVAEAKA